MPTNFPAGTNPSQLATIDLNRDGHLDLLIINLGWPLQVLLGNGEGTFVLGSQLGNWGGGYRMAAGFLNSDPWLDVAFVRRDSIAAFLGTPGGSLSEEPYAYHGGPGAQVLSVTIGDANSDGVGDLLVGIQGARSMSVFLGASDGPFVEDGRYGTAGEAVQLLLADATGDGLADAVSFGAGRHVAIIPALHHGAVSVAPGSQDPPSIVHGVRVGPVPAHGIVHFGFKLGRPSRVSLEVFDTSGRRVARLLRESRLDAGSHVHAWNGLNESGGGTPSGVYFMRLTAEKASLTERIVLIR